MKPSLPDSKPARTLSWIVAVILCLLPFHALLATWATSNFGHPDLFRTWKEVLIVLCLPLAAWLIFKNPGLKKLLAKSWIVRLIVLYLLIQLAWGIWALKTSRVNDAALAYGLGINLRFFGFFIVCLVAGATATMLARNWPKILLWPAGLVVAFGLAQHFILPDNFLRHFGYGPKTIVPYQAVDANSRYVRVQSTLRGANPLGAYLVLIIPAVVAVFRRRLAACALYAVAAGAALYYSYSRSAWIGTAMAVGIIVWLLLHRLPRWALGGLVALVILAGGGIYGLRDNQSVQDIFFHTSKSSVSASSSNFVRDSAIKDALQEVRHQPLGNGTGTAGPASFRNNHPSRIAEDYYLQVAQEVGVLGLAIFVAIVGLAAWQLWLLRQELLPKILLASLVGISFVNLVSHAWADDTLSLLWWGLAGVAMGPAILKANKHKANEKTQQKPA
jgi:O-antigen ligase